MTLAAHDNDIQKASRFLYDNKSFVAMVAMFYRDEFWNKMKLDEVLYQNTAEEIFIFGVNAGKRTAIRKAQKIVGAVQDGLIGPMTIKALNDYNEAEFDMKFDNMEIEYYDYLIAKKPSFEIFKNGWRNRAEYV